MRSILQLEPPFWALGFFRSSHRSILKEKKFPFSITYNSNTIEFFRRNFMVKNYLDFDFLSIKKKWRYQNLKNVRFQKLSYLDLFVSDLSRIFLNIYFFWVKISQVGGIGWGICESLTSTDPNNIGSQNGTWFHNFLNHAIINSQNSNCG